MPLTIDNYGFPEITSAAELTHAVGLGHKNVRVHCLCGRGFVTSIANADVVIHQDKCNCKSAETVRVNRHTVKGAVFIHDEDSELF